MRRRKRKRPPALALVGVLLLAGALGLAGYNMWENCEAGRESRAALRELLSEMPGREGGAVDSGASGGPGSGASRPGGAEEAGGEAPGETGTAGAAPERTEEPEESRADDGAEAPAQGAPAESGRPRPAGEIVYPDYVLNPEMEMPQKEIGGYGYIATLGLPTLGLELPVMGKWDYHRLRIAPCRYTGSAYTGDLVIAAHNYASHFGSLSSLRLGDEVALTDMDGNVFRYRVGEITTLQPGAVEEMTSGEWPLTLFTCTVGGRQRVTVRCEYAQ